MSTAKSIQVEASKVVRLERAGEGRYLGPAEVVGKRADRLELRLPSGSVVEARSALALPYEAELGDELLVVGEHGSHYVIGVLRGQGTTQLAFEGDVELRARGGQLRIAGERGVTVEGPSVEVHTDRYAIVAELATTIAGNLRTAVRELFTLRSKEHHTQVEGDVLQHSRRARLVAEEKVTVNGKEIFLG